jgi:hypothetical protein
MVRGRLEVGERWYVSLLSAAVPDLSESPVFIRVPKEANRPKVVARVVPIYGLLLGTLRFDGISRPHETGHFEFAQTGHSHFAATLRKSRLVLQRKAAILKYEKQPYE